MSANATTPAPLPTPDQFLHECGGMFSRNTLHRWLRSGRIRSIQPGGKRGKRYIPRAELLRVLNAEPKPQASHLARWHENREATAS